MLVEGSHIGKTIIDAEYMLSNLHLADTNRSSLGEVFLDPDTIMMVLHIIGYTNDNLCFVTPELLDP